MDIHNQLIEIVQYTLDNPHELCKNDCNMLVMRVIDLFAGTNVSKRKYKTIKSGIAGLKKEGFEHTGELVKHYCDEVKFSTDGDIWLDPDNPLIMGVVISNRLVGIDSNHEKFILIEKPTKGNYYRLRK